MELSRLSILPVVASLCAAASLGCGGSAPEPASSEQVAVVDMSTPPPPAQAAAKPVPPKEEPALDEADEKASDEKASEEQAQYGMSGVGGLSGDGGGGGAVGLGSIGTGGGGTLGLGTGSGFGRGSGGRNGATPPKLTVGATNVTGKLPPEVIQRLVRQNFGRFRLCYENGLQQNPTLAGKVAVRFVIAKNGSVAGVSDAGSTMKDAGVKACTLKSFQSLSFPEPEGGGQVIVVYPITFSPGEPAPKPAAPPAASSSPPAAPAPAPAPKPAPSTP